jgi:hypothetical protein
MPLNDARRIVAAVLHRATHKGPDRSARPTHEHKTAFDACNLARDVCALRVVGPTARLILCRRNGSRRLSLRISEWERISTGCGLGAVQARFKRLIDVDEYLQSYSTWCSQIEPQLDQRKPEPFIAYMMPGPGILLAGTYLIFGHHKYIYLQVIQALADALGVLLIAGIGRRFLTESIAICGAYFYAVFVPQARLAIAGGLRDAWMPILLLVTLYCFGSGCLFPASDFARRAVLDSASRVFAALRPGASFRGKCGNLCTRRCIASTLVDSKF